MSLDPAGRLHRRLISVTIAALFAAAPLARADDAQRIDALEKKLEQTLRQVQQLSNELRELRSQKAAPAAAAVPAAPAAGAAQAEKIEHLQQQVDQLTAGLATRGNEDQGLPIHGFADVGWQANTNQQHLALAGSNNTGTRGFQIASLDFYLNPQLGDRVKTLAELIFEVNRDQGVVGTDLERLQMGYTVNNDLTVWLGRFHTPYGYWNTAFHHGAQIQTSIYRPQFLDFEDSGGILPAHTVGLWANGGTRVGPGKVTYDLYVGNGPKISGATATGANATASLDPNLRGNDTHSMESGANLGYEFRGALDGLKLGGHFLRRANVHDDLANFNRTDLNVLGAYGVYITDDWEVMTEFYNFHNVDKSGTTGSHASWAYYGQIGRPIGKFTPYARWERTRLDQADNYFAYLETGQSYMRSLAGLRYDLTPRVALKIELGHFNATDRQTYSSNEARTQFAIRF